MADSACIYSRFFSIPTLRVGMPAATLCVANRGTVGYGTHSVPECVPTQSVGTIQVGLESALRAGTLAVLHDPLFFPFPVAILLCGAFVVGLFALG